MSNNTTDFPLCQNPTFTTAVNIFILTLNHVVLPIYFTFGLSGHILCLRAYYRKSTKEHAYLNQIFVTVSETFQIFASSIHVVSQGLWAFGKGPDWFLTCYPCMDFLARCSGAIQNMAITITLFLTLNMAVDRLIAIWKPHIYRNRCHKRDHALIASICVIVGVLINVYQFFQSKAIHMGGGRYTVAMATDDMEPSSVAFLTALAAFRVAIRLLVTLCLLICNVALTHAYYKRAHKFEQMTQSASAKDRKKKAEDQKTLLLLSIVQSLYLGIGMSMHGCMVTLVYTLPSFFNCGYRIMSPATEIVLQGGDIGVFVVMVVTRPHYRKMIIAEIPCCRNKIDGEITNSKE